MTTPSIAESKDRSIVSFVLQLKSDDDRGALALLRGALADSQERQMRAWRVLARFGGIPGEDPHKADVVRTIAGLLSLPQLRHARGSGSFGCACRHLLDADEFKLLSKPDQPGPVSRRMQHLFAATRGEICDRIRQLGRRLDGVEHPPTLDFNGLYTDLLLWSDRVKARWAADFWGATEESDTFNPEAAA